MPGYKNMIDQTYLVSDTIVPVDAREIDKLAARLLGGKLPRGYREYLSRFGGKGQHNDTLSVHIPEQVKSLESQGWDYELLVSDAPEPHFQPEDLPRLLEFGSTDHGDRLIYCERFPEEIFVKYHNWDEIARIEVGFLDPLRLAFHQKVDCFRFFQPDNGTSKYDYFNYETPLSIEEVAKLVENYWKPAKPIREKMPTEGYAEEGFYYVFVKAVGGKFGVCPDDMSSEHGVCIRCTYQEQSAAEVEAFINTMNENIPELD